MASAAGSPNPKTPNKRPPQLQIQSTPGSTGSVKIAEFNTNTTAWMEKNEVLEPIELVLKDVTSFLDSSPQRADIHDSLKEYCNTAGEVDRYRHFVKFANHGLALMNELSVEGFKSPKVGDHPWCLFHRNDPNVINLSRPDLLDSERKPDLILLEFQHVILDATHQDSEWQDIAFGQACRPPAFTKESGRKWTWEHPLLCAEFKKRRSKLIGPPKDWKADTPLAHIAPALLPSLDGFELEVNQSQPETPITPDTPGASVVPTPAKRNKLATPQSFSTRTSRSVSQGASTSQTTSKRLLEDSTESGLSKKAKVAQTASSHPVLQTALYAAAKLSLSARIGHVINLHIEDENLFLWYFDHEGPIQTSGLNIVANFPYFLLLLFIFTRFDRSHFGELSEFTLDSEPESRNENPGWPSTRHAVISTKNYAIILDETQRLAPRAPTLKGRDPKVYDLSNAYVKNLNTKEVGLDAVAKFSWAQTSRVPEAEIIKQVTTIITEAKAGYLHVQGHIPEVYDFHRIGYDTNTIRIHLKLLTEAGPSNRALVFMMSRKLFPITELVGEQFWKAYWECVNCLYVEFKHGIWHLDVSVSNLMYSKAESVSPSNKLTITEDGGSATETAFEIRGVLNDCDLARLVKPGDKYTPNKERTGTLPFMALDLLTVRGWAGEVTRAFR